MKHGRRVDSVDKPVSYFDGYFLAHTVVSNCDQETGIYKEIAIVPLMTFNAK